MPRLVSTVHARNPETGLVEALVVGSELPDWAAGMVDESRLEFDESEVNAEAEKAEAEKAAPARKSRKAAELEADE